MKSSLVLTAVLALAAVLAVATPGGAQTETDDRGYVANVTNETTPGHERLRPYKFTTRGQVRAPKKRCPPGTHPSPGHNCVPKICPPGNPDLRYCQDPTAEAICSGIVNVRFQKETTTISSRNVEVRSDCTYRSTVSFDSRLRTRLGRLHVRARFQGNELLRPKTSLTHAVRVG